jgi:DtxR family Mn-dependent transcriptional regulator
MFMSEVTSVTEEYLECIYRLQQRDGVARTNALCTCLNVVPGTVTNTVRKLKKEGLVIHQPYKGVKLSERGRKIALNVLRKHRLSERLLTDILHVGWDEAHEAACKLEHGLTHNVVEQLDAVLGHPETCPHGNPIPTQTGVIHERDLVTVSNLKKKESGLIARISEEDSAVLRYLETLGLKPGKGVEITAKEPFDDHFTIRTENESHVLGRYVASKIWVKKA